MLPVFHSGARVTGNANISLGVIPGPRDAGAPGIEGYLELDLAPTLALPGASTASAAAPGRLVFGLPLIDNLSLGCLLGLLTLILHPLTGVLGVALFHSGPGAPGDADLDLGVMHGPGGAGAPGDDGVLKYDHGPTLALPGTSSSAGAPTRAPCRWGRSCCSWEPLLSPW